MEQAQATPANNSRLIGRLLLLVAAAFAFAFALVPLYNVLCEATGFNGKVTVRDGFGVGLMLQLGAIGAVVEPHRQAEH